MYFMTSIQLHLETTRIILKWSLLCGISSWNCSARGDFKNAPKDFVSVIVQKSTSHLWKVMDPLDQWMLGKSFYDALVCQKREAFQKQP